MMAPRLVSGSTRFEPVATIDRPDGQTVVMRNVGGRYLLQREPQGEWIAVIRDGAGNWVEAVTGTIHAADGRIIRSTPRSTGYGVDIAAACTVKAEPISWLWRGWLAAGKVHLLAGAPGTGKTSLAMAIAATLSVGGRWPDGTRAKTSDVLIWSGEDDLADTLIPRLIAAGADLERVHLIKGFIDDKGPRAFDPSRDAQDLADRLADMDPPPAMLVIDPIVSAVAGDSHKNAEVRRSLQPLVDLAMLRRCAVVGITHFSKGTSGQDPIERVTGSLAFGALARIVLATGKLAEDAGGKRILARGKSNIGPDDGGFAYDMDVIVLPGEIETTRILWGAPIQGSAREILAQAEQQEDIGERSATEEAVEWLASFLAAGPVSAKDVQREAKEAGISEKSLRRGRERLKVRPSKAGFSGGWQWALPSEEGDKAP